MHGHVLSTKGSQLTEVTTMRSTTLRYIPCDCIKRGDCILPGTRGHLVVQVKGKIIPIRKCLYCRKGR